MTAVSRELGTRKWGQAKASAALGAYHADDGSRTALPVSFDQPRQPHTIGYPIASPSRMAVRGLRELRPDIHRLRHRFDAKLRRVWFRIKLIHELSELKLASLEPSSDAAQYPDEHALVKPRASLKTVERPDAAEKMRVPSPREPASRPLSDAFYGRTTRFRQCPQLASHSTPARARRDLHRPVPSC